MSGPTVKVQTWGDDLRIPCFINAAETTGLLMELEPLRRPTNPFQSKHLPALKRNKWFVMRRGVERAGLVVVWPEQKCCIYISGDPVTPKKPMTRVALLRIRIDPQFLANGAGLTVFAARLSSASRRLIIEDTLVWKGRYVVNEETFTSRWKLAVQWIEHYCLLDPRLLSGIEIEMAKWLPLEKLKPEATWELQSDEPGRNRYFWIANHADSFSTPSPGPQVVAQAPILDADPLIANAARDVGPEQWLLSAGDGTSLGRALIRTLAVSERLRSSKTPKIHVEVQWNPTFSKWEIKAVSESLATMSAANFEASK